MRAFAGHKLTFESNLFLKLAFSPFKQQPSKFVRLVFSHRERFPPPSAGDEGESLGLDGDAGSLDMFLNVPGNNNEVRFPPIVLPSRLSVRSQLDQRGRRQMIHFNEKNLLH